MLKQIKRYQEEITTDALPGVTAAGQVKFLVSEAQLNLLRHMTAKTPAEKKTFDNEIDSVAGQITKAFGD